MATAVIPTTFWLREHGGRLSRHQSCLPSSFTSRGIQGTEKLKRESGDGSEASSPGFKPAGQSQAILYFSPPLKGNLPGEQWEVLISSRQIAGDTCIQSHTLSEILSFPDNRIHD